jgi:light-regulated signal transduction histidine kinase (bacteriophytochrome)
MNSIVDKLLAVSSKQKDAQVHILEMLKFGTKDALDAMLETLGYKSLAFGLIQISIQAMKRSYVLFARTRKEVPLRCKETLGRYIKK